MRRLLAVLRTNLARLGIAGLVVGIVVGVFLASVFASAFPGWTGFAADPLPPGTAATPVVMYDQNKELWDWLQLLLVPLVLAVGGYWLTRTENRYALELQERREKDAALQAYLDQMTELLLHEKLRISQPEAEVRSVARARTLTVLKQLDGERKARVVQFLYEAGLISAKDNAGAATKPIVGLQDADLRGVILEYLNLQGIDLSGADLEGAKLHPLILNGARLRGTNLSKTELFGISLKGADLEGAYFLHASMKLANLIDANLTGAVFNDANSTHARFVGANLSKAHLERADLKDADFTGAILTETNFKDAKLEYAKGLPIEDRQS